MPLQQRRRLPAWGQWLTWVNWGYTKYHSATFSLRNREWRGLSLLSSFMWAKNLTSSESPINNDANNYDFRNWDLWRGKAVLTPDYRFVTAWSYRLPFGKGQTYARRRRRRRPGRMGLERDRRVHDRSASAHQSDG